MGRLSKGLCGQLGATSTESQVGGPVLSGPHWVAKGLWRISQDPLTVARGDTGGHPEVGEWGRLSLAHPSWHAGDKLSSLPCPQPRTAQGRPLPHFCPRGSRKPPHPCEPHLTQAPGSTLGAEMEPTTWVH